MLLIRAPHFYVCVCHEGMLSLTQPFRSEFSWNNLSAVRSDPDKMATVALETRIDILSAWRDEPERI